jgi:hypothetical protein
MRWLLVLVPILFLGIADARADEFVAGTEDVPLMPGLQLVAGSDLVFDKPEGRIVEAQMQGALTRAKVQAFYAASLPQLGWKKTGTDQWQREAERLKLNFRGQDGRLIVGFTISPQ